MAHRRDDETRRVRIATRGSALAMAQSRLVAGLCRDADGRLEVGLQVIKTTGDRMQAASWRASGQTLPKGLFTKELEVALIEGEADLAVHSLKDLPTELPDGLRLGGVLLRADPRDVLVGRRGWDVRCPGGGMEALREGAVVATSSTRRAAQLRWRRPDIRIVGIRGNVPTRLAKLAATQEFDATLLAAAGLERLGIRLDAEGRVLEAEDGSVGGWGLELRGRPLDLEEMLPAPGQAAIGLEIRKGDRRLLALCRRIEDAVSRECVEAERAFLAGFGGGCLSPVAAWARVEGEALRLRAVAFEGERRWEGTGNAPVSGARRLGRTMGREARRALARRSG
ncbi:MAG: hydroxymethylbilane synthase [Verrucomicrobiae bacterium]|nr:hydroxymethylbilane synthase [Verrucomicrobiae bacterium]